MCMFLCASLYIYVYACVHKCVHMCFCVCAFPPAWLYVCLYVLVYLLYLITVHIYHLPVDSYSAIPTPSTFYCEVPAGGMYCTTGLGSVSTPV